MSQNITLTSEDRGDMSLFSLLGLYVLSIVLCAVSEWVASSSFCAVTSELFPRLFLV